MRHVLAVPVVAVVAFACAAGCGAPKSRLEAASGEPGGSAGAGIVAPCVVVPEAVAPPAVEDALRRQDGRLRPCWDRLALEHPDVVGGRAIVRFQIDPSGQVLSAEMLSSPVEDPSFRACVEQRAMEMNFPQGDASSVFHHAFEFGASAGGGVE